MLQDDRDPPTTGVQVGYYIESFRSALPLVRSIGVLSIVVAAIRVPFVLIRVHGFFTGLTSGRVSGSGWKWYWLPVSIIVPGILAIVLLIGGIGFLQRVPRGRRVLIDWAWASVAWTACVIAMMTPNLLSKRLSGNQLIEGIGVATFYAERWVSDLVLPVIVLVLMRRAIVGDAFEKGAKA